MSVKDIIKEINVDKKISKKLINEPKYIEIINPAKQPSKIPKEPTRPPKSKNIFLIVLEVAPMVIKMAI